jgi:anti-sigma factor RsiW
MDGMKWLFQEPPRDPRLSEALRNQEAASQTLDAELHRRIVAAAQPRLEQLRASGPCWWEWITRWIPVAVPIGLAASLAGALLLPGSVDLTNISSSTAEAGVDSTLVIAAFSEAGTGSELAAHLVAPATNEWLFEEAVSR